MSDQTKKPKGTTGSTTKAKAIAQTQLVDGLARLFDSGEYFDLTVKCEDHEWKVHRAVLCPRSKFFRKSVQGRVSGTSRTTTALPHCLLTLLFRSQEGISHVIELKEDDPALLREVLLACYTCGYDDTVGGDNKNNNKLDFNARMYAMADKYDIAFLKKLSTAMLQAQLDGPMITPRFLKAVRTIYTTTLSSDRGLRDLLVPVLKKHRSALSNDAGFLNLIKSGLADGDFAADLTVALSQLPDPKPELVYFCPDCNPHAPSSSQLIPCDRSGCGKWMSGAQKP